MEKEFDPQRFGVTAELFREWRKPRFGNANPQKIKSKVWEWLVNSRLSAYAATQIMEASSAMVAGPTWNFDRIGQSVTELSDGRRIFIAGEHEDFYDPDFYIYNDVVVTYPDGTVDFYCYRRADFPPTDFHTATRVGEKIVIIGNLGYQEERYHGYTQLYALDLGNFEIQKLESSGEPPGWIYDHTAVLSEDETSIVVTKGKLHIGQGNPLIENLDDWKLSLDNWHWEKLVERKWTQFGIRRKDRGGLHFFLIRTALLDLKMNQVDRYQEMMSDLSMFLGHLPDVEKINDLYNFDMEHSELQKDKAVHNRFYFYIDGVRVRITEGDYDLQIVIEGEISDEKESLIKRQLLEKVSALVNSPCEVEEYENRE
ncbi:MAG: hypothetical protein PVJ21_00415 [Anaerolineales bacterium]